MDNRYKGLGSSSEPGNFLQYWLHDRGLPILVWPIEFAKHAIAQGNNVISSQLSAEVMGESSVKISPR